MQCKKCDTEIKDGYLFCHVCGEAVQIVPDYEPELDDLKIGLDKEEQQIIEPLCEEYKKKASEEKKKSFPNFWIFMTLLAVLVLGAIAFFLAYHSILKKQDPEVMQNTDLIEVVPEKISIAAPKFSLPGGVYSYYIKLELTTDTDGTVYYTLDGSIPDENASVYKEPIKLEEGKTVLRAFVIDKDGNSSEVVSEVYQIEFGAPDAPAIFPQSGEYVGEYYIRIAVPANCAAYYTLDGTNPRESSEKYSGEFLMPEGRSIVKAVLVNSKGNFSEVTTVEYYCTSVDEE